MRGLRPRRIAASLAVGLVLVPLAAIAQAPAKPARVAFLCAGFCRIASDRYEEGKAFREALREAGYLDGQTVVIDDRAAGVEDGQLERSASELVRRRVDMIVARGVAAARAVRTATGTLPIVMIDVADAMDADLVVSLARPAGNVTGLTVPLTELVVRASRSPRPSSSAPSG